MQLLSPFVIYIFMLIVGRSVHNAFFIRLNRYAPTFRNNCKLSAHSSVNQEKTQTPIPEYEHLIIEKKWQDYWEKEQIFKTIRRKGQPKKYVLDMFPYPSGSGLHVGHPEGYTATDIMSRYWRMAGYDVLHPMGWDAFGLPAEQNAINTGTHPAVTTYQNIANFKRQLKSLGFSYDWNLELATTDENYVRWTQWIFIQLFKNNLAAQSEVSVNWCPALGTVLANEEIIDGLSERGSFPVVRMPLRQWVLKITEYADKLEAGLDKLDWPEGTLSAQKSWIGRSEGANIRFKVQGSVSDTIVEVFTTRPDTIMGVTYVVLAPENPLTKQLVTAAEYENVQKYLSFVATKSDLERTSTGKDKGKTGVFSGSYVTHPFTRESIPIWIADYVLSTYGTGAVMAVPAHDDRDFAFAEKFSLPIKKVVASALDAEDVLPYTNRGILINSGDELNGRTSDDVMPVLERLLKDAGDAGETRVSYRLRDWVFSRQRYWGEPIPIYFPVELTGPGEDPASSDPRKGAPHRILYDSPIAVPEEELPLLLPEMEDFKPGDDPQGCLARAVDWRYFKREDKWYARETNTMPQWAGSCWYYLRFADPKNLSQLFSEEAASWFPVDLYVGGQEHAVLHLLYARFWHKFLFDIGVVSHEEPFLKLVHQGMILGSDGEKMSKSRGNVVNPDEVVREFGADALRLYEMFMGPLEAVKPWQTSQLSGVVRFREKVYSLVMKYIATTETESPEKGDETALLREMHKTIQRVTGNIDRMSFNTAISCMMIYTNTLQSAMSNNQVIPKVAVENLILLLSPFAPHIAEECWQHLGHSNSLAYQEWPKFDEALCIDSIVTVAIQVNGKVRGKMEIEKDLAESEALLEAMKVPGLSKWVDGMEIKKVVYVPGRILNILVKK